MNRRYEGHIGEVDFEFDFENGPKIKGELADALKKVANVNGSGNWGAGQDEDGMLTNVRT